MVHLLSAAIGAYLISLWLLGLRWDVRPWTTWLIGAAGLFAVGVAMIDREQASRATRGTSLVWFGLALNGFLLIAWVHGVAPWFLAAAAAAASAALVVGLLAVAAAAPKRSRRVSRRTM